MPAKLPHPHGVVSFRPGPVLGAAIATAAGASGASPGGWLRELAAERLGVEFDGARSPKPVQRHRAPSARQRDLREAVRQLGAIGSTLASRSETPPDLLASIREAVALTVAAVAAPR